MRIFFGFYKTRQILVYDSTNRTVLRAVVLTQYRRVTDGQTDGIVVASTALSMRALRRAVIKLNTDYLNLYFNVTISVFTVTYDYRVS